MTHRQATLNVYVGTYGNVRKLHRPHVVRCLRYDFNYSL